MTIHHACATDADCCCSVYEGTRQKVDEIHEFIGELKGLLDSLSANPMMAALLPKGR